MAGRSITDEYRDYEDLLVLLSRHRVRYLIIGGMAFAFHAVPRYTKDIDLWLDPEKKNVERANKALAEFGSPYLLDPEDSDEILQLGVEPNRIDLIRKVKGVRFATAWSRRLRRRFGRAPANWIHLDDLIRIKAAIGNDPRHQKDVMVLREVRRRLSRKNKTKKS